MTFWYLKCYPVNIFKSTPDVDIIQVHCLHWASVRVEVGPWTWTKACINVFLRTNFNYMLQYQAVLGSCYCLNTRTTWTPWLFNFCSYSGIHEKWINWRNYSRTNILFRNIFVVFHVIAYCTGDIKISMGFNAPNEYKDKFFPSPWGAKFQLCTKTLHLMVHSLIVLLCETLALSTTVWDERYCYDV